MAVELGRFIKDQLKNLPQNHLDREYLEGLLSTTESYNEGDDRDAVELTDIDHTEVIQAIKEYQSEPHTPELVTQVFQAIWSRRGKVVGKTYEVSPCPYTQGEIEYLERQEKRVGYFPPQLATQESRHLLDKMFPKMEIDSVEKDNPGTPVTNDENQSGWLDYEIGADAPYLNTDITGRVANDGRNLKLLNLNQYIIASQDNKLLTGQYLDGYWVSVQLGSCDEDCVIYANIDKDGRLGVIWYLRSDNNYCGGGGRFSGVKKA